MYENVAKKRSKKSVPSGLQVVIVSRRKGTRGKHWKGAVADHIALHQQGRCFSPFFLSENDLRQRRLRKQPVYWGANSDVNPRRFHISSAQLFVDPPSAYKSSEQQLYRVFASRLKLHGN